MRHFARRLWRIANRRHVGLTGLVRRRFVGLRGMREPGLHAEGITGFAARHFSLLIMDAKLTLQASYRP
ncbi:hypothetical protein ACLFKT_37550, partial [Paraburkholderia sp. BR14261]